MRVSLLQGMTALALLCSAARAGIVLEDPVMWSNAPPTTESWGSNAPTVGTGLATVDNPGTGGAGEGEGFLRITFQQQDAPPQFEEDVVWTQDGAYTGDYRAVNEPDLGIQFNFYAEDLLPGSTIIFIHSASNDTLWEHSFDQTVLGGWQQHAIKFSDGNWLGPGSQEDFWEDLATVDWIGVLVERSLDTREQQFGLDNWTYLAIPEPGTTLVLTAALCSMAITFRRRLRGS